MTDDTEEDFTASGDDVISLRIDSITALLVTADGLRDPKLKAAALKTVDIAQATIRKASKAAEVVTFLGKPAERGPFSKDEDHGS